MTASTSSVGVVITAYNGEAFIRQAVESALASSRFRAHVIVVDDGSATTPAAALAGLESDFMTLVRQPNAGVAAARNTGFALLPADIDYVLFLDQDDELLPGALDDLLVELRLHSFAAGAIGAPTFVDEKGEKLHPQPPDLLHDRRSVRGRALIEVAAGAPVTADSLAYRNCIYTPGQVLLRRSSLTRVGGFRPVASPSDDWDLWFRLSGDESLIVTTIPTTLIRRHSHNVSSDDQVMRTSEIAFRRTLLEQPAYRSIASVGFRASERGYAVDWWRRSFETLDGDRPRPFRWHMRARVGLFVLWSILGLRSHVLLRRLAGQSADPRFRRR